jgi:hypothetical protein
VTYGKKHLPLLPLSLQLRPGELGLRCSSPTHAVIVRPPLLLPEPRRHLARNRCSFPDSRANLAAITPPPLLIPQSDASLGRCGGPRSSSRSASAAPPRPTPRQCRRCAGSRSGSCRRKKREKPGRQTHQRIVQCRSCRGEMRSYRGPRSAGPPLATTGAAASPPLSRRRGGCYGRRG